MSLLLFDVVSRYLLLKVVAVVITWGLCWSSIGLVFTSCEKIIQTFTFINNWFGGGGLIVLALLRQVWVPGPAGERWMEGCVCIWIPINSKLWILEHLLESIVSKYIFGESTILLLCFVLFSGLQFFHVVNVSFWHRLLQIDTRCLRESVFDLILLELLKCEWVHSAQKFLISF